MFDRDEARFAEVAGEMPARETAGDTPARAIGDRRRERALSAAETAEWLALEAVLTCYARDFGVGAFRDEAPRHDEALARALAAHDGGAGWLRLPFDAARVDVFCPVVHRSASGRHRLAPHAVVRARRDGSVRRLVRAADAMRLVERELDAATHAERANPDRPRARLANAISSSTAILEHADTAGFRSLDDVRFLAAEQSLAAGHGGHPLSKSRWGFSPEDVQRFSPELGKGFRLHYMLAHPDIVLSDHVRGPGLELLRTRILDDARTSVEARRLLDRSPCFRLVPVHPWEAAWLARNPQIASARASGALAMLGEAGPELFATSSVRTVYQPDLPFSLKLSLHVGITNSERTNHLHELRRGCAVSRLLDSPWGRSLATAYPALGFLRDDGFIALAASGTMIEGTGVALRANDFDPSARLALLAAFCEPPLRGPTLLHATVSAVGAARALPLRDAAALFFDRYLELLFENVLGAYESHGLALEIHQQNLLLELDAEGLPSRLLFRDNQGYFFRRGKAADVLRHAPSLEAESPCIVAEAALHGPLAYYLLVNNVLGLVEALSSQGLCDEPRALAMVRARLAERRDHDSTGFVRGVLAARSWPAKANLRMTLEDRDEARRPIDAPATYIDLPNPLAEPGHPAAALVRPRRGAVLYRRPFADYGAAIEIRAFELDRDLAFVHDWVNRSYAKRFWCMDGPIAELESAYAELLAGGVGSAFVGEIEGRPAFVFETYWAPRDVVGTVYDAKPGDYGFHMLACPSEYRRKGLPRRAFLTALEMCFGVPEVTRIVGEADRRNLAVDALIESVGYRLERVVRLPDKEANLTFCTRESFVARCPEVRP